MKTLAILILITELELYSCSQGTVYFKNDLGETVRCEGEPETVKACIEKYEESAGYKRFKEPEMERPMGGPDY